MSKPDRKPEQADFEEFDFADRMRRALRVSGVGVGEMAQILDTDRNTIGNWINGRIVPRRTSVMAFALATGARYEWLMSGECTPRDLNPEPTD